MVWFLSIAVGLLVPAAVTEYLIALRAVSHAETVPVRVRSGRREPS